MSKGEQVATRTRDALLALGAYAYVGQKMSGGWRLCYDLEGTEITLKDLRRLLKLSGAAFGESAFIDPTTED